MSDFEFAPRSAFAGLAMPAAVAGNVFVTDCDGLGLATVLVRKGQTAALAARVKEVFDMDLPRGGRRVARHEFAFAGTGPGAWLASSDVVGNGLLPALQKAVGDLASISDQSDGYAALRLSGSKVRETLLKLVSIDLLPAVFKPGDVAVTLAAHMSINLWRLDDLADCSPVFELTVFRSLAQSFWHVLMGSASEYGVVIRFHDRGAEKRVRAADSVVL